MGPAGTTWPTEVRWDRSRRTWRSSGVASSTGSPNLPRQPRSMPKGRGMNGDVVIVERVIKARPATVFAFFTERDRWLSWQGVSAEIDPRPGGVFRMNVRGNGYVSGEFV